MRYLALASDYDGTLAHDGAMPKTTRAALERFKASGRKLLMVTGRELPELEKVCPELPLFDRVVAENGAVVFRPDTREVTLLAEPPGKEFVDALKARGVGPISAGHVIVATWTPHETAVLETIRDMGLELQVIFNKGAVMVLPSGVNKYTGLKAALDELGLSVHNCVAVGDAENDHIFLKNAECGVAVSNALESLKKEADIVTRRDHGEGVEELVGWILEDDLADRTSGQTRHHILFGRRTDDDKEVLLPPAGHNIMVAGTSGGGKSTLVTGLLERWSARGYQYVLMDPEGDHEALPRTAMIGTPDHAPGVDEVMKLLEKPRERVVVNMLGVVPADRPRFFMNVFPHLMQLRAHTGRPHWIVVDETHHMLPANYDPAVVTLPRSLTGMLYITVHPEHVSADVLAGVTTLIAVGEAVEKTVKEFAERTGQPVPAIPQRSGDVEEKHVLLWMRGQEPYWVRPEPGRSAHMRHRRKYAEGELAPERSFYFRGPEGKLNLRAQNLQLFMQIAEGVDEETWKHHLRKGDFSRWFSWAIKDEELAKQVSAVEKQRDISARESRELIRKAIQEKYTLPA